MAKITKRAVDALQPDERRDVFTWDSELRGFGVRGKPSGVKTFLIQYRNVEGRTRRLILGQYGALTPENAREMAREKLAGVAKGEDPSAERHAIRAGMSVSDVCDWYLEDVNGAAIFLKMGAGKFPSLAGWRSAVRVIGASVFWRPGATLQGRRNGSSGGVRLEARGLGQEVGVPAPNRCTRPQTGPSLGPRPTDDPLKSDPGRRRVGERASDGRTRKSPDDQALRPHGRRDHAR
jgi:Arm DNA-binding domain